MMKNIVDTSSLMSVSRRGQVWIGKDWLEMVIFILLCYFYLTTNCYIVTYDISAVTVTMC